MPVKTLSLKIIRRKFTIQVRKRAERGYLQKSCCLIGQLLSSHSIQDLSMGLGHRMLQPSPDLRLKWIVFTGVKAALLLLPKCSPLDCRKWVHKKLFCLPAAKLYFCPGSHHTICQHCARHLLLGLLPSPQDSVRNQSCERCSHGAITILFSGSCIILFLQDQWGQQSFQVTYCSGKGPILYCLAAILILLLLISSLFIPSTSPFKTQNSSEEINNVYVAHRKYTECLCTALGWNQSFMKWKLGQQSLTSG